MKVLVLDTIHGGGVLAEALLRRGHDVDALDVYRGGTLSPEEVCNREYDLVTAPVHLDPDFPLMQLKNIISHHEMTARLCDKIAVPLVEITGKYGKTTTSFALSHALGGNGIVHTSRGTFSGNKLLFRKSITPASLLFAVTAAEKEHAPWIIAEESLGVAGCGTLGILTSAEDYRIASGKRSALDAKLTSLARCRKVLVPSGIPLQDGWYCVDDLVQVSKDTVNYDGGSFKNSLVHLAVYRDALKTAAAAALLLEKDPEVLASFETVEGRMQYLTIDDVPVLDNANSGVNVQRAVEAAEYLRSITDKEIYLVIGQEHHAICEGFSEEDIASAIRMIQPVKVFRVGEGASFDMVKRQALITARTHNACVLLAVKVWR
ncbi:MAG TPA: coenzyme F430 synthase [Methanocorpusculum sp.]|nr:coenzyme F430 synthase [Methanocorpusculum sp.]